MGMGSRLVVCGISGGVDSAVAAALLLRAGHKVVGVHMENWDEQDEAGLCTKQREEDLKDAKGVCDHLRIPFVKVNFVKEYWHDVFTPLLQDYEKGFTPNPDVLCNSFLKFGSFYAYAKKAFESDCLIATGHYAQVQRDAYGGKARLFRALDATKDQTLFLSGIRQEPLSATAFPLGHLYKNQVRKLAKEEFGLDKMAGKRDSTGICFIGAKQKFTRFIREYIPDKPGFFVDLETGQILGEHRGVHHFTIGQRCRLGGLPNRVYVVARDPRTQVIYAVHDKDHPSLYCDTFWGEEPHWICDQPEYSEDSPFLCMFKFQHTEWTTPCLLYKDERGGGVRVKCAIPSRALTPGQQAVFYKGNECLGSSKIFWVDVLNRLGLVPPAADDKGCLVRTSRNDSSISESKSEERLASSSYS